jgi:hypothetical protein
MELEKNSNQIYNKIILPTAISAVKHRSTPPARSIVVNSRSHIVI